MVGFLCYRVWIVWRGSDPPPPGGGPKKPASDGQVDVALPPPPVAKGVPPPVAELKRSNPFWLHGPVSGESSSSGSTAATGGSQAAPDVKLLGIVGTGDKVMARIQVDGS